CKMQLGEYREAIQYFSNVVRQRPKNVSSWESLIRCLYKGEYYDEAYEQVQAALKLTDKKPVFYFYLSAIQFARGRFQEGLLQLENALINAPRLLKKILELNPALLKYTQVVDLIARY